ncbi:MAG: hypothetical protein AMJ84_05470 [Acidithiobacillales bacterium SM23_46]|nr:MAG: hypothetical protein AMJ84_05470 [Acidithiobacillales bacterium SM23_46]KPL27967.1 MAG: hypothetical protein AMJ72_05885 [Acidithiobacillales bacterium SM1_46]
MGVISKSWGSQSQIIGSGDGYVTLSGTTESYSSDVDLETNGYEGAHVTVEMDYDSSPTDEVNIKLYGSLDGSNYDDTPIWQMQGNHDVDPQQLSFVVKDLAHFRIGVVQTGSTDSHDVRAYCQPWRYNSA